MRVGRGLDSRLGSRIERFRWVYSWNSSRSENRQRIELFIPRIKALYWFIVWNKIGIDALFLE